jgi:hypothetical protein
MEASNPHLGQQIHQKVGSKKPAFHLSKWLCSDVTHVRGSPFDFQPLISTIMQSNGGKKKTNIQ